MMYDVTIIPVLVSALLATAVAYVWFSPLVFGVAWMRACGLSLDERIQKNTMLKMVATAVAFHTIFFFVIAQLLAQEIMSLHGLMLSCVWYVLSIATQQGVIATLERKSLVYLCIIVGYTAIVVFGGIGVIAYWPW